MLTKITEIFIYNSKMFIISFKNGRKWKTVQDVNWSGSSNMTFNSTKDAQSYIKSNFPESTETFFEKESFLNSKKARINTHHRSSNITYYTVDVKPFLFWKTIETGNWAGFDPVEFDSFESAINYIVNTFSNISYEDIKY